MNNKFDRYTNRHLILPILLLIIFIIFLTKDYTLPEIWRVMTSIIKFGDKAQSYFLFTDDWNWIVTILLISILIILFCLNDLVFLRLLKMRSIKLDSITKRYARLAVAFVLLFLELIIISYSLTKTATSPYIVQPTDIDPRKSYTVLVLGTRKYLDSLNHNINLYYQERIKSTVLIGNLVTVNEFVISGDYQPEVGYDEPGDMKSDIVHYGMDPNIITLDRSGHRTYSSIVNLIRSKRTQNIIIISQYFHLERAVMIARENNVQAIGVASDGSMTMAMFQRELLAKPRVLLDLLVFNPGEVIKRERFRFYSPLDLLTALLVLFVLFLSAFLLRAALRFR